MQRFLFLILGLASGILPCASLRAEAEVFPSYEEASLFYSKETFHTATRSLQYLNRTTENVTVITREELDRWPAADLDEALGLINGIVIQDDGHLGQVATAQIYGSKEEEVRVMVDGITFNPTTTGGIADLSQIPLDIVEKIEIIKGASSSVWGSSQGGVINIITRPVGQDWKPQVILTSSYGEFRTERQRGEVKGAAGPLRYYAAGSYVESGGFRPHGGVLEKRGFLKAELPFTEDLMLFGSFGYSGSKVNEFQFPLLGFELDRQVLSRYGRAGLSYVWGEQARSEMIYKISERSFNRNTVILPAAFFRAVPARSLIHEVSVTSVVELTDHQRLVFGSDVGVEILRAKNNTLGTIRFNVNKNATRHAYYLNYQLSLWRFDMTAGSRLDSVNSYGVNLDPHLGLVFHLPFWDSHFRANVSRGFNAPSLVDRFVSVGTVVANPDLKAEHSVVYHLGLESSPVPWLHAKTVFFQTFVEDSVRLLRRSDGLFQNVNVDSERRTGVEAEISAGPWKGLSASYGTVYVKAVDPGKGPVQSRPRWTQDVKVNFETEIAGFRFNAHLAGRYLDLVTYTGSGFTDPIDQTFIFDGKIILTLPKIFLGNFSLFLEGENLFNHDFAFDGVNDPNPERNFEAGVQYRLLEF